MPTADVNGMMGPVNLSVNHPDAASVIAYLQ